MINSLGYYFINVFRAFPLHFFAFLETNEYKGNFRKNSPEKGRKGQKRAEKGRKKSQYADNIHGLVKNNADTFDIR